MGGLAYTSVRIVYHTCQKSSLILQIPYTQTLQPGHTVTPNPTCPCVTSISLSHQLCLVASGKSELAHIRYDDECASENAFISCFGAFDKLRTEDHV
jgi:hypothetical protein